MVAVLLLRRRRRHHLQAALPERRPARQGRRRAGRRPAHRLDPRHQADRRQPGRDHDRGRGATTRRCTRARRRSIRATSLSGIANRYIALTPGPEQRAASSTTARRSATDNDDVDRRPRPALQHARPQDARGAAAGHPGHAHVVRRQAATQANAAAKYFNPALSTTRAAGQRGRPRPADARAPSSSTRARTTTALAERRDDLAEPRLQRQHDRGGDRRRERGARPRRSALLPGTLRKANTTFVNLRATLDDLDVLVAASKPATKDLAPLPARAAPARRSDARPTIADLRTLVRRRGAEQRPRPTCSRKAPRARAASPSRRSRTRSTALQQARRRSSTSSGPTRPTSSAGSATSARARPTTTPTATSRASSRSSTPSRSPTTRRAACSRRDPAEPAARRPADRQRPALPGRRHARPPADGSAPFRDADGTLDCDPSLVLPGP